MIAVKNVGKSYPFYGTVLNNISFTVPDGQFVGVLGKNGAGKTTLLRLLAGVLRGTGEIRYDGKKAEDCYQEIAYITEKGSFFPEMTAGEYAEFLESFFPRFDRKRYEQLLEFLEVPRRKRAGTFSKGQKSKLEIAAGFSKGARYILMDEPFSGKDLFARRDFLKLLAGGLKTEETVLISTHELDEIEGVLDRALILRTGCLVKDVMLEDLREQGENLADCFAETLGYDGQRYRNYCK